MNIHREYEDKLNIEYSKKYVLKTHARSQLIKYPFSLLNESEKEKRSHNHFLSLSRQTYT